MVLFKILLFTGIAVVAYALAGGETVKPQAPASNPAPTKINAEPSAEDLFMSNDFDISDLVEASRRRNK